MNKTVMAPIFAETQDLDEVGADAYFKRQAVRYMASHPLDVMRTSAAKVAVSIASIHPNLPLTAPRNLAGMLDNALLLILAGIGLARFARSPMAIGAQYSDISKHFRAQHSDISKHFTAQYTDISKQGDEREARGGSWVFAGMCLVTITLLAIGPAGMRYWLTLRGACWILAASTLSRLIPRTLSSSAPARP
jgi:hypothetical protein